jgi:hypothetical protein
MNKRLILLISFLTVLLLTACASSQGNEAGSPAAGALENYLKALASKDEARLVSLTCADWEENALLEFDSFQAVKTELADLSCQQTGSDEEAALVKCQGKILATYTNEVQEFELGGRTYRMVQNGADWQVCGYTVE